METEERDITKLLLRVQRMINLAEGSNNNPPDSPEWHALNAEQETARKMADELMTAYALQDAIAQMGKPVQERMRPMSESFEGGIGDLQKYVDDLAYTLADFTRTKVRYAGYDYKSGVRLYKVYGFESDVRYFTFLYTTLRLHLVGALRPELDKSKSMEENCYVLHNAGYGWREIARMYGWTTQMEWDYDSYTDKEVWYSPEGKKWEGETRIAVRPYRSAYFRECKRRGETPVMNIQPHSYRLDAATGYLDRIRGRLREVEEGRNITGGSALALRIEDIEQFIREESGNCTPCPKCGKLSLFDYRCDICGNTEGMPGEPPEPYVAEECPKCKKAKSGSCREHSYSSGRRRYRTFSQAGYDAGRRQANSADLGGARATASTTKSIN